MANQKGGAGKTTTVVSLAGALSEAGQRVLVVDLDPQASASEWLGAHEFEPAFLEVFQERRKLSDLVSSTAVPGVDLVSGSPWLIGAERTVALGPGAETFWWSDSGTR